MISTRITFSSSFKKLPPIGKIPYKDPHRRIHLKNLEALKKEMKAEKKKLVKETEKEVVRDIQAQKKAVSEYNDRYRRLHII